MFNFFIRDIYWYRWDTFIDLLRAPDVSKISVECIMLYKPCKDEGIVGFVSFIMCVLKYSIIHAIFMLVTGRIIKI